MPSHSHIAHWIGTIGELLNFIGALVLARDLFLRRRESAEIERLDLIGQWGRKHGLSAEYKNISIGAPDFTERVRGRRASLLGYWGMGFLALGFLSLVSYHLVAIYHGE
jgi:hypothetical protein